MRSHLIWPLVLIACVIRPLEDSATDGAGTNSTGSPPATTGPGATSSTTVTPTTGQTTTEPATTGTSATTAPGTSTSTSTSTTGTSTTDPLTGGTSSTATTDVSTSGDPSDTLGDKLDLPQPAPADDSSLVDCTQDAPPGTALAGVTKQGMFTGNRAYFGKWKFDNKLISPVFMFLSPEAGTWELWEQSGSSGAIIHGTALTDPFNAWIGDWTFDGEVKTNNGSDKVATQLEITGFAGNWDAPDPGDPPRLVGNVTGEVTGPFDAVFCSNLNIIPPP